MIVKSDESMEKIVFEASKYVRIRFAILISLAKLIEDVMRVFSEQVGDGLKSLGMGWLTKN